MKKLTFSLGLLVWSVGVLFGQRERVPGQVLFQLRENYPVNTLISRLHELPWAKRASCSPVAEALNIWMVRLESRWEMEDKLLLWLSAQPEVRAAQYNHRLEYRGAFSAIPDDPLYSSQWHHRNFAMAGADLASEAAWDIATGGLTPQGDTLVIAIIDTGIDAQHEDLQPNLWFNWGEIPNDGVDNDQNGYVDDFRGWNASTKNDEISGTSMWHGTPVAALAGARGNNSKGIAGVNWAVKILFVAGSSTEDIILSSFDYVLRARRRYNATHGQQGAFVVAANCSWGINGGKPSDAPLWCAAFDSLGAAGILSVAATANLPVDVDTYGDLPTTCPSDFLVSVTSLNGQNQKAPNAAWGPLSIDLGTYGEGVFSARPGNSYGNASGTSFATPLVTGAIALLYAAPCNNLIAMAKANPSAAALWVKNHLLTNTLPTPALQGLTRTGGRLHLSQLLKSYEAQCAPCVPPFGLSATPMGKDSLRLSWSVVHSASPVAIRWRQKGTLDWNTASAVQSPFFLGGLIPCTDYEFSFQTWCGPTVVSHWTSPITVTTSGCCTAPQELAIEAIGSSQAVLSWLGPAAASGYFVQLTRPTGTIDTFHTTTSSLPLTLLLPCATYRVEVAAVCGVEDTSNSTTFTFITGGCGPCLDQSYCTAGAAHANQEWIEQIEIGAWSHAPGSGVGYHNFTGVLDNLPKLQVDSPVPVLLRPGYASQTYGEHFRVYIDYNGDGDFFDAGELAFDPGFPVTDAVEGTITAPASAWLGMTRLRVLMKYRGVSSNPPAPCEQFEFGQVVDYCVVIEKAMEAADVGLRPQLRLYPNPAQHRMWVAWDGSQEEMARVRVFDTAGRLMLDQALMLIPAETAALDIATLPEGLFFVEMTVQSVPFFEKILVQRP